MAWEKWSPFSRDRYLEEVQKFAKSGFVAEKKAYFEARYKRIASKKATDADADAEAPPPGNNPPEPETSNEHYNTSSDDFDTVKLPKSCCSKSSAQGRAGASKLGVSPAQDAMDKKRVTHCCVKTVSSRQPQPSVACGSKSGSPTISTPFRFRSEERVAQRKEARLQIHHSYYLSVFLCLLRIQFADILINCNASSSRN